VTRAIRDSDTNVVVVDGRGALSAFGITSFSENDAHLVLLAVCQTRRRNGLGSAVLLWLEAVARSAGAARIRVECRCSNEAARNFYSEHGFHERTIRKGMYAGVVNGIELEKWLRRDV
jgi:ribosomal-protein-alanine N-acetyltransferase